MSLLVNNTPIQFQFDTGSPCSILSKQSYEVLKNPKLSPVNVGLRAYGGNSVSVQGRLNANVIYNNKHLNLPLIIVDIESGANIMGLDWITALGFKVVDEHGLNIKNILQVNYNHQELLSGIEALCRQYHSIFENVLGTAKNFEAHLTLKSNAQPKYQKARPLPFALMERVKLELQCLVEYKNIEPIQTSERGVTDRSYS